MTPITKVADSGKDANAPVFLTLDSRIPASLRELMLEADGCFASGFYTGSTACAHRALEALLKMEKAEGSTHEARIRSLGEKTLGVPPLLISVLTQLGDGPARDSAKLTISTLQLFLTTLKAAAYEIYVVGPERGERLQHVRRLLDATDRKTEAPPERKATPATLAGMSNTPIAS